MAFCFEDRRILMIDADTDATPAGQPPPLILFLHGIGERGSGDGELARAARWGLPKWRRSGRALTDAPFPFRVVAPQCPPDRMWWDDGEILGGLVDLLDRLVGDGLADRQRIVLTGFSMGGIGVFALALAEPRRFAAIAPVCGRCPQPDRLAELAHIPTWIAWGEDDSHRQLADGSAEAAARLAPFGKLTVRRYRLGATAEESAHVRAGDAAYAEPDLYRWMLAQRLP
jgi:predicted peptidase